MRLWSLHPSLLDTKRLVAVWREGLLAKKVLEGNTKGYCNHPQLIRFKATNNPLAYINSYLWVICEYAVQQKGYNFNTSKLDNTYYRYGFDHITVTDGQLKYEFEHLCKKLALDCPPILPLAHNMFKVVPGTIECWERV
jgi:hypothetical protein